MKKPTLQEIKDTMLRLKMRVFTKDFDVTLGGIRDGDPYSNTFNDFLFMLYHEKGELKGVVIEGTVDAGLGSRKMPSHPDGVAIIQHTKQYMGVYQYQNPKENPDHWGHRGNEAFRQIAPMDYWRDNNMDEKADFEGKTYTGIFNTNIHNMGVLGINVNSWSEGCPGSVEQKMRLLYDIAKLQRDSGLGDIFSFAILHENDFKPRFEAIK
ncbi:MAG TPA: hypothetical protein GX519_02475 [Thermoanaerobacterales bacterium]|nr:hypothetical protein [Thermoanaerobacterales bacterium]